MHLHFTTENKTDRSLAKFPNWIFCLRPFEQSLQEGENSSIWLNYHFVGSFFIFSHAKEIQNL